MWYHNKMDLLFGLFLKTIISTGFEATNYEICHRNESSFYISILSNIRHDMSKWYNHDKWLDLQ